VLIKLGNMDNLFFLSLSEVWNPGMCVHCSLVICVLIHAAYALVSLKVKVLSVFVDEAR
jgi:hypothetical protein